MKQIGIQRRNGTHTLYCCFTWPNMLILIMWNSVNMSIVPWELKGRYPLLLVLSKSRKTSCKYFFRKLYLWKCVTLTILSVKILLWPFKSGHGWHIFWVEKSQFACDIAQMASLSNAMGIITCKLWIKITSASLSTLISCAFLNMTSI